MLEVAKQKLKDNETYVVHAQYPIDVIERRKELIPIMLEARKKKTHRSSQG